MKRYIAPLLTIVFGLLEVSLANAQASRVGPFTARAACPSSGCPISIHGPITDRWNIVSSPGSEFVYYSEPITSGVALLATPLINNHTFLSNHLVRGATVSGPVITANPAIPECCIFTNYTRTPIYLSDSAGNQLSQTPSFQIIRCQPASFICAPQADWLRVNGAPTEQIFKTF